MCNLVSPNSVGARAPPYQLLIGEPTIALDHRDLLIALGEALQDIPCADFAFAQDSQIKAAATARVKPFRHVRTPKSYAEFVTRHARLRYFDHRVSNAELIADVNRRFVQLYRRKVLTEHSVGQLHVGKLCLPEGIMFGGIDIHRFVRPPVHSQVGLLVTVEIEPTQHDAACYWLFVYTSGHGLPVPL